MRIDKFISCTGTASRREAAALAKKGGVTVNGETVRDLSRHIDPETDRVVYGGETIVYRKYTYVMLNKPEGYVSATDDRSAPFVMELLPPEFSKAGMFPCGRLDKDTVGLMIITNDGPLAHMLLHPKRHVSKTYRFSCESALIPEAERKFEAGIDLGDFVSAGARLVCGENRMGGEVTISEGKYHQIKRMFTALGNRITYLERISFGGVDLDPGLARGEWRLCTDDEIATLKANFEAK